MEIAVVIAIVVGFVLFAILVLVVIFKVFISSRYRMVKPLANLRYLPEIVVEKEVFIENRKKLSKLQLRRVRMREIDRQLRATQAKQNHNEDADDKLEEGKESAPLHSEQSLKMLSWVISAFSGKNNKVISRDSEDIEFGGFSSKSTVNMSSKSAGGSMMEGSSKSKRFISQDRLQRKEARMLLVRPKSAVAEEEVQSEEEDEHDNVVSLLSLAVAKRKRIQDIMEGRKQRKGPGGEQSVVDVVALNAGPPVELIPVGYELVSQDLGAAIISPEVLIYKRVLYLWDGTVGNITGWFIGTIVGISESQGFNYRIKYDREETKSIFVDGIHPVFLSLSGENAYGRKWVALQKRAAARSPVKK